MSDNDKGIFRTVAEFTIGAAGVVNDIINPGTSNDVDNLVEQAADVREIEKSNSDSEANKQYIQETYNSIVLDDD